MTPDGHLFLVGFMGAGKSTVAELVAQRLGRPCVDLDDVITRRAGRSVTAIFSEDGEDTFRALESEALMGLAGQLPAVVACGGGIVVRPENRAVLKDLGLVVYLQVTAGEALARVGDAGTRPLLAGGSGTIAATALLSARESLYKSVADISIDTVGKGAVEVADEIVVAMGGDVA